MPISLSLAGPHLKGASTCSHELISSLPKAGETTPDEPKATACLLGVQRLNSRMDSRQQSTVLASWHSHHGAVQPASLVLDLAQLQILTVPHLHAGVLAGQMEFLEMAH